MRGFGTALLFAGLLLGVVGCVSGVNTLAPERTEAQKAEATHQALLEAQRAEFERRRAEQAAQRAERARQEAMRRARDVRVGCPAPAPPTTGQSVATASDWVELRRSRCLDGCPAYTVRVSGDGRVEWMGEDEVAVKGPAYASVDTNDARALMQRIADRGYWPMCTQYGAQRDDWQTVTTTLGLGGQVKRVEDGGGSAPSWLSALDDDIDRVADTHQWRHGGPLVETFAGDHAVVDAASPKKGVTPLMKAAAGTNMKVLAEQLKLLTGVNAKDSSGWTALMYAAQAGTLDGMKLILENGGDPFARSNAGETVMSAAVSGWQEIKGKVMALQARGLSVNARDDRGVSPLMLAHKYGWHEVGVVDLLLKLGADVQARDAEGRTAEQYAPAGIRVPSVVLNPPVVGRRD